MSSTFRVEHDFLGEKQIPDPAYWGVHTARALENFPISGTPLSAMPQLIRAFGYVKKATARANAQLGALDGPRCEVLGHRLVIERRRPSGSYQAPQAFPPHVGLLAL